MMSPSTPASLRLGQEAFKAWGVEDVVVGHYGDRDVVHLLDPRRPGLRTSAGLVPAARDLTAASWIDLPSAIGSENGIPSSMMSAPPATSALDHLLGGLDVRVSSHDVGDERPLASQRPEDGLDAAQISRPALFAIIWTSLSPRPESVTTTVSSFFIFPASLTA